MTPAIVGIVVVAFLAIETLKRIGGGIGGGGSDPLPPLTLTSWRPPVIFTAADLVNFASNAGFQGDDLQIAVAVALAESRGNSNAYNPEIAAKAPDGRGSFGLWQIYRNAHPEFDGVDLYDPQTNAIAAFSVYSGAGRSFRPWSTFKYGQYTAHLDDAQNAISG